MRRHTLLLLSAFGCSLPAAPLAAAPRDEPRGRTWFERVERDRDRGAGRVVDRSTWELQRLNEDRDVRLRRLRPRREFERLDEENDRRHPIDSLARQADRGGDATGRPSGSVILDQPRSGGAVMSPMASQAAADERTLADAKDRLSRSLRAVNVAEQRALRSLRRRLNREGRAGEFDAQAGPIRERHEQLRAGHRGDYERLRARVLGRR